MAIAPGETDGDAFGFIEMEFLALRTTHGAHNED